jgi:DNA-binding MarR family transcriptional regulator
MEQFGTVKKRISALAAQAYARAELGTLQAKLVRQIGRAGPLSQAELARATDTDVPLTGRALQALIERDLVQRERSEQDRREYVLSLTPAGRRMNQRILKLREELVVRIVGALDERDLADFERIAAKILAATAG